MYILSLITADVNISLNLKKELSQNQRWFINRRFTFVQCLHSQSHAWFSKKKLPGLFLVFLIVSSLQFVQAGDQKNNEIASKTEPPFHAYLFIENSYISRVCRCQIWIGLSLEVGTSFSDQGWEYEGQGERCAPNFLFALLAKISEEHKHQDFSLHFLWYNAFFMYLIVWVEIMIMHLLRMVHFVKKEMTILKPLRSDVISAAWLMLPFLRP